MRSGRHHAFFLSLAACSSKSDPPAPTPPPAPARDAAPDAPPEAAPVDLAQPCLPARLAAAEIALVRADGPRVTACWGPGDDTPGSLTACLVFDELGAVLGPRAWDDAEAAERAARPHPQLIAEVELGDDVRRQGLRSDDGNLAFVIEGARGVIYDLRTEKQIGAIPWRTAPAHSTRWVGTHLLVRDEMELERAWQTTLYATSGDALALGDERDAITVIDAELLVVARGAQLRLVDVERLAATATLALPLAPEPRAPRVATPRVRAATFSDRVVIATSRPPLLGFIDRTAGTLAPPIVVPICR